MVAYGAGVSLEPVITDLAGEHAALDAVVASLDEEGWNLPTPSPGWTSHHQIAHLTFFDGTATTAITDPDRFKAETAELLRAAVEGGDLDTPTLAWALDLSATELLQRWRDGRDALLTAAEGLDADARVPWYGPSMGARSFLTARLMETWAHGQDVVDTVSARTGVDRPATDRLRHVAQIGVITRTWSYVNRGLDVPDATVAVHLDAPSGDSWSWNRDGIESVSGPAEDFALVVTQRRHVDDTALVCDGAAARDWMEKAQAFAGAATEGPVRNGA